MNPRLHRVIMLTLCVLGAGFMGGVFTWDAPSGVGDWGVPGNWDVVGCIEAFCVPDSTSDDAIFPATFEVTLDDDYAIDDITISDPGGDESDPGGVFDGDGTVFTVTADSITLTGGAGGGAVAVKNKARITTN